MAGSVFRNPLAELELREAFGKVGVLRRPTARSGVTLLRRE